MAPIWQAVNKYLRDKYSDENDLGLRWTQHEEHSMSLTRLVVSWCAHSVLTPLCVHMYRETLQPNHTKLSQPRLLPD